ncbi:DUF4234 domain-containing protein [Bacillus sp. PS06]|uniref:DUF4234 domain-containing protein n=1 Tax=Bacillus sp. PS06 TaxID=2764176 RepID=UPI001786085A|nr:DUF4234 domain-containing protein [Bacillus sp. PS06]MBD8071142.1 DUF4234 domain-containing protein [Bacillus sp. PS06]
MFKKTNIALMVLLTIITMGIYIPYWFLTRRKGFEGFSDQKLSYFLIICLLVINSTTFFYSFFQSLFLSEYGIAIFDSLETVFTFIGLGLLYFSAFRAKEAIENEFQEEMFNPVLLVLFHIWYLQFKINRLDWNDVASSYRVVNE